MRAAQPKFGLRYQESASRRRLDKNWRRFRLRYRRQRRRTQVFLKDTAAVRIGPAAPRPKESRGATTRRLTSGGTRRKIGEKRATLRQVGGGETPEKCTRWETSGFSAFLPLGSFWGRLVAPWSPKSRNGQPKKLDFRPSVQQGTLQAIENVFLMTPVMI